MTAKNKYVISFNVYSTNDDIKQVLIEADKFSFSSLDKTAEFSIGEETVAAFTNVNFILKSEEQNG